MFTQASAEFHSSIFRQAGWLAILLAITLLTSCGGGQQPVSDTSSNGWLTALPNGLKGASTTAQVNGSDHVMASLTGVTDTPPAAVIDGADQDYSYAIYSFDPPVDEQVLSIEYNLSNFTSSDTISECWLGLANYGYGRWEWRRIPSTGGTGTVDFTNPDDYYGLDGNTYWAIVAARDKGVRVDSFTVTHLSTIMPMFYNPPAGQQTADSSGLAPQVVLMPPMSSNGQTTTPVIVYTKSDAGQPLLMMSYYAGSSWQQLPLYNSRSFSVPQARWLDGEGAVVAYDATNSQLLDIRVDMWWEPVDETAIPLPSGEAVVPVMLSLDVDPLTGRLGVAYALAGDPARIYTNFEGEEGWSDPVFVAEYTGESVPGLSFKFDPAGGDPWLAFTHGVAEYDTEMTVEYSMEFGRFDGTAWSLTDSGRSDSPMGVELGFDGTTPQVVFSEVREGDVAINILPPIIVYHIHVPLLVDCVTGTYNGTNWVYERVFESTISNSINLGTMVLTLNLNMAPACGWAKTKELYYNHVDGSVDFLVDINGGSPTVTPQGGTLTNSVEYMIDSGSGYTSSGYFSGAPGMGLSWIARDTEHACAYIAKESVTVDDITSGQLFSENTLYYWTPAE